MSWSLMYSYARAQALDDGVLIEVPAGLAAEAGLRLPMAATRPV